MSCAAVYSLVWFRGLKLMSPGALAVYVKGPEIVSRSWVPMATRVRFLHEGTEISSIQSLLSLLNIQYFLNTDFYQLKVQIAVVLFLDEELIIRGVVSWSKIAAFLFAAPIYSFTP